MAERRVPRLMGPMEIQLRLGTSRQWTYVLTNRRDFPEPIAELGMGKVWLAEDVEQWITEHRPDLAEDAEGE